MTRILLAGALANRPGNGGGASVRMTWATGLRRLGFDVWFVEQIDRRQLVPENGARRPAADSPAVRYFDTVTRRHGLEGRAALLDERGGRLAGASPEEVEAAAEGAVLVNISGHLRLPRLLGRCRRRVYVDLDPGFTQFWHADGLDAGRLDLHDQFFSVGLSIGRSGCAIPRNGLRWRPLPPPVVLDEWEGAEGGLEAFTTVAAWRGSFGGVSHRGKIFGSKAHEFRRFIALPERLPAATEIALDIHPGDSGDRAALEEHGWRVVDPKQRVPDPTAYREYIRASWAEFSVAQGVYVETKSGWFSDRTARYLAAGRPALVQETGFSEHLPVGEGLLSFRTPDEAVAGGERIASDYRHHSQRARQIAREYLDSDRVLGEFCAEVGAAP